MSNAAEATEKTGLRFAMVTTFYPPNHFGGDAVFIRRLAHSLARRGHSVDVIHDVDAFELLYRGEPPAALVEPEGVRTHPLRSRLGLLSCLATHQLGRPVFHGSRIRRILEDGEFDVIHFHNVSLVGGPGVLSYGSAIKLYTAHEHWLVCPTHVLWRHNRELCTGRECLRCSLNYRRPPQPWRHTGSLQKAVREVDAFTSPSAFSAQKHREFGFERELEVMPYFLPDLDSGAERESTDAGDEHPDPYFLFVGRLEKIKGLQDVLAHFGRDAAADLLVVGAGEYENELRRLASDYPRVHFLGFRTPEQLRQLYRQALAVIVPSVCYETFGIVLLEAFRESTPVIARAIGPFVEIVNVSGGGYLFENDHELATAIEKLATDRALRNTLGGAGHTALKKHWMEEVVLQQYFELILRIARERSHTDVVETLERNSEVCPSSLIPEALEQQR